MRCNRVSCGHDMHEHGTGGSSGVHAGPCAMVHCVCPGFCMPPERSVPDGAIGSDVWPGLAKLIEECGETLQVVGKVLAYPQGNHPDGTDVIQRLSDETADLAAILTFATQANRLDMDAWHARRSEKARRFHDWHQHERH